MTSVFIAGVVVGLLLRPTWRLVAHLCTRHEAEHLEVHSKERLQMLTRDGHL